MKNNIFSIEGADSSGKDSIVEELEARDQIFGPIHKGRMSVNSNPFDKLFVSVAKRSQPLEMLSAKFVLAYLGAVRDVNQLNIASLNAPLVQVSLAAVRSYAFYKSIGGTFEKHSELFKRIIKRYPTPNLAVVLYASRDERIERLKKKQSISAFDSLAFSHPKLIDNIADQIAVISLDFFGAHLIDTTGKSLDEVVIDVASLIVSSGLYKG